jgi:hypothetical protein
MSSNNTNDVGFLTNWRMVGSTISSFNAKPASAGVRTP